MKNGLYIILLLFGMNSLLAQSVEDAFHSAGNLYINGKNNEAKATIDEALQRYPNDPELIELRSRIKDEEKQENQNQQNQDQQQDQDEQQQDQQQNNEQQDQKDKDEQQQQQQAQPQEISKEDAERLLEALEQDEKEVMEKVQEQKRQARKIPVEKEW